MFLCVIMRERVRAFSAAMECVTFWYSFFHYKVQFLWCTFQVNFGIGTRHFQKVVLRMIVSLIVIFHLPYSLDRVVKIYFHSCRYQNQNFLLVSHSCHTRVVHVTLVSFMSHSCCIRVALVSLVSGARIVKWARSVYSVRAAAWYNI